MTKIKKYALNNSYFKNKSGIMPDSILEIAKYHEEKNELPFEYNGENWVYDAFVERQKRKGVIFSQFLTPDATAKVIAELAEIYFEPCSFVLDMCSGTGQLTKHLADKHFHIKGIDVDFEMIDLCKIIYKNESFVTFEQGYYEDYKGSVSYIVSNPPYEDIVNFFEFLNNALKENDMMCILILPLGTWDKERPKRLVELKNKFILLEKREMQEPFARTNANAEILILQKR